MSSEIAAYAFIHVNHSRINFKLLKSLSVSQDNKRCLFFQVLVLVWNLLQFEAITFCLVVVWHSLLNFADAVRCRSELNTL